MIRLQDGLPLAMYLLVADSRLSNRSWRFFKFAGNAGRRVLNEVVA